MKLLRKVFSYAGFLCVLTTTAFAQDNQLKLNHDCNNNVTSMRFLEVDNMSANIFAKYCIEEKNSSEGLEKKRLPDAKLVRGILKRYENVYLTLDTQLEKAIFVDLFLRQLTRKYIISTNAYLENDDEFSVIFNTYNPRLDIVSGYALSLFQDEKISLKQFWQFTKNENRSQDAKLTGLVFYILEGNEKKLLTQPQTESQISYLTANTDEQDDDIIAEWETEDQE